MNTDATRDKRCTEKSQSTVEEHGKDAQRIIKLHKQGKLTDAETKRLLDALKATYSCCH